MIILNPSFTFPNFVLYMILHNSVGPYQMPLRELFPRYYTILCGAHTNTAVFATTNSTTNTQLTLRTLN